MKLLQVSLLGLTFMLLGCVHYKEYPFPHSNETTVDSRLSGTWKIDINKTDFQKLYNEKKPTNNKNQMLVFKPNKDNSMYMLYLGSPGKASTIIVHAYTSSLKNNQYLNVSQGQNSDEFNHYKYTVSNNALILYRQNHKVLMKDIKDKKLWGIVSPNGVLPISEIYIAEKPERYKQYLLSHDEELYNLPLYLTR